MKCIVCCLALLMVGSAMARSNGAPSAACDSMTPDHGQAARTGSSPFKTLPQSLSVNGGGSLQLVIEAPGGERFKGYLMMAFDESNAIRGPIGTFSNPSDGKTMNCGSALPNAVTHSNNDQKSKVTVTWTPPANFIGKVVFRTTYVQSFDTFWVKESSSTVQVSGNGGGTTKPSAAVTLTPTTSAAAILTLGFVIALFSFRFNGVRF